MITNHAPDCACECSELYGACYVSNLETNASLARQSSYSEKRTLESNLKLSESRCKHLADKLTEVQEQNKKFRDKLSLAGPGHDTFRFKSAQYLEGEVKRLFTKQDKLEDENARLKEHIRKIEAQNKELLSERDELQSYKADVAMYKEMINEHCIERDELRCKLRAKGTLQEEVATWKRHAELWKEEARLSIEEQARLQRDLRLLTIKERTY